MSSPAQSRSLTRRAALGRVAGVAGLATATGTVTGAPSRTVTPTVMTQNVYLGVGLTELIGAESLPAVRRTLGELFERVEPSLYGARADGLAAAIETADPAVVALQEVATIRKQVPGDFGDPLGERASDVVVDVRASLRTALDDRDLDYRVAAETVTNDLELPAETDDGSIDLRLTDRNLLLVRDDVDVGDVTTGSYEATVQVPIPDTNFQLNVQRGYCMADVTVDGDAFTAVSTHLESTSTSVRRRQARQLRDVVPTTGPLVLAGDFNSAPGGAAYDLLTESLTDLHAELRPDADGYTCCQADDLRNDQSQLGRRIDAILYRGLDPTAVGRVGHRTGDRVTAQLGGETVRVWPSDHAGVVGSFELTTQSPPPTGTPTRTATATPTRTATATQARTTTGASGPGLGVVAGLLGLLVGVDRCRRRSE